MLKDFRVNISVRVLVLLLVAIGVVISIENEMYLIAGLLLVGLASIIVSFIRYVNQTNRDLANFFSAVQYDDFTANTSSATKGAAFEDLHQGFNLVNRKFRDIRAEKEANHQFLQTIVRNVEVGLLCVNEKEEVILMNDALQELLHKSYLVNLSGLKKVDDKLSEIVEQLKPGQRELLKISIQNDLLQLSIQLVEMRMPQEVYRLYTFQNIQNELEAQELISWQKLIRILTHEIMNSVAPISSLSSTMFQWLQVDEELDERRLDQIKRSIGVIQKRSEGLLAFTETYRRLTRLPPPQFELLNVQSLIEEVATLMSSDFEEHQVQLELVYRNEGLTINGDPNLMEQVLINLVKNALDAVKHQEEGKIQIVVFYTPKGKVGIKIIDNGMGIPEEKLEQIFIPFFTTKEEGSGIGLSLSRQIMRMHQGTIELQSTVGEGTVVTLLI